MTAPRPPKKRPPGPSGGPRQGRPVGSIKLTPEMADRIVAFIEGGVFDYVAAEAAGIHARTFRDLVSRGEGRHPDRAATPFLQAFAKRVREAKARARAAREIVVADRDPKFWLTHSARSRPGREGWTEPVEDPDGDGFGAEGPPVYQSSQEELAEIIRVLAEAGVVPTCLDPDCGCQQERSNHDEP
jgi:hypothetical protein